MIIGNPDNFAFYFDVIKDWSTQTEINGISGVYINGSPILSNYGLIPLDSDFFNFYENFNRLNDTPDLFELNDVLLLKKLIMCRFPNWWAYSEDDWNNKINWEDKQECTTNDFRLESFSIGNIKKYYLFCVKNQGLVKLLLYVKDDGDDFFNLNLISIGNIKKIELTYNELKNYVNELHFKLEELALIS